MASLDSDRQPSVIASHVGITYRVFGTGRETALDDDETSVLRRLFSRSTQGVGVREVRAVKDVSFVAYRGESIGLVGRNGSGKSTLLRSIAGLVPPTEGKLWYAGTASLLGINAVLLPKLSGRANIWIGAQALGMRPKEVRAKMQDIIDFADIGEFIDLPMSTYSSGMGARLRFAISTAVVPDILVVDEALATGDAGFKERAQERIEQIRAQAGTIFTVSHSEKAIKASCDRVLWLDRGELIMDGPPEEVVDAYSATFGKTKRRREAAAAKSSPTPRKA